MIGALAPWYGSKRTLAAQIVRQLGEHRVYWEPFCGSMAVLFAKERVTYETVNDLHQDLINLALVVQDEEMALDLYGRVSRLLFHEDLLALAKEHLTSSAADPSRPDVERAYWYLVFSWMGFNGISGTPLNRTGSICVRYSGQGGNGATRWSSVVDSIPDWHRRLLGVQIINRDAFDVLKRIDDEDGTALYIDPPYLTKGARYVHDFLPTDHVRLAGLLHRLKKSRIVVSYYDHPMLKDLYPTWSTVTSAQLGMNRNMLNTRRQNGAVEAPEVLLVNGPVYHQQGEMF